MYGSKRRRSRNAPFRLRKYVRIEYLARTEGIICAIESAHAVYEAMQIAPKMSKDDIIIVCLSGRGDKDVAAIARYKGRDLHE